MRRVLLLAVHWAIIINFLIEIVYAGHMVFNVIAPEGGGPLMGRAAEFPFEKMMTRRLYASEAWIAITGLSLYLAITEIGPRMWKLTRRADAVHPASFSNRDGES